MIVKYIKNHWSGKVKEIKEQSDDFGNYLILKGVAVKELKAERITKEFKENYESK
jgi:hypothetical protein